MTSATPFESDIAEQPDALLRLAESDLPELRSVVTRAWDRIVFTGMGSSDYASVPTWRRLVASGLPAWSVDTSQLLDDPGLITPGTLLIATSQSGASGEMVELLERRAAGAVRPGFLVGIADVEDSPLAESAELFLPLHSGPEATVSTKSYLNTLGVHRLVAGAFAGDDVASVREEIVGAADAVRTVLRDVDVSSTASAAAEHPARRLAYVGRCDEAATARFAGLITKESSKVPAEGFVGGQFRHGPYELAGDGLTAVIFGLRRSAPDESLLRLSEDLLATGSRVVLVGDYELDGAVAVPVGGSTDLSRLAASSVVAELLAVGLARANGVVPGKFLYGSKITTAV